MGPTGRRSVSWRVNAERLMLLGWGRAILLQLAHPLIAAGVYEHSSFRTTPLAAVMRLHQTVHAMLSLTFGDETQREQTLDGIRAIHRRVNGQLPETVGIYSSGTPYSAEDPDLVMWVHATLLESIPLVYDLFRPPLSIAERDAYCAEAAPVALALGAREDAVPRAWHQLRSYIDSMYEAGTIVVGRQGRELGQALLAAPVVRRMPLVGTVNRTTTLGLLPAHVRDQYRFEWTPRDQRRFERVLPRVRALRRITPEMLALWRPAR